MSLLSDTKIRPTKATDRQQKLTDGDGLHLMIMPSSTKTWRLRLQGGGRDHIATLGTYPAVGLAEVRRKRDTGAAAEREGPDPADAIKPPAPAAPARTLEAEAREWHAANARIWAPHHSADLLASLEREIFPACGAVPIAAVTAPQVQVALQAIEACGAVEMAQQISAVLGYGVALGRAPANPVSALRRVLTPVMRSGGRACVVTPDDVGWYWPHRRRWRHIR